MQMHSIHALWLLLLLASCSQSPSHASTLSSVLPAKDNATALLHQTVELLHSSEQHDDTDADCPLLRTDNTTPNCWLHLATRSAVTQLSTNANPARAPPYSSSLH
jgi:hypothetical protein